MAKRVGSERNSPVDHECNPHEARPQGLSGVAPHGASGLLERPPHALLALPASPSRTELLRLLELESRVTHWAPSAGSPGTESMGLRDIDVAVFHAAHLSASCIGLIHDPKTGFPELVFVVDDTCSAQRLALLSRGYRHVIDETRLSVWLPSALPSLCTLARARRIVLEACASVPSIPDAALGKAPGRRMNLHTAETTFREVYLRALLLEQGSRRKAAEAAGVPYRSFCEMLRKLQIADRDEESSPPSGASRMMS